MIRILEFIGLQLLAWAGWHVERPAAGEGVTVRIDGHKGERLAIGPGAKIRIHESNLPAR